MYTRIAPATAVLCAFALLFVLPVARPGAAGAAAPPPRPVGHVLSGTPALPGRRPNALIVLDAGDVDGTRAAVAAIKERGGRVVHLYPPHVAIAYLPAGADAALTSQAGIVAVSRGAVDPAAVAGYGPLAEMAVQAWNSTLLGLPATRTPAPTAPAPRTPANDALVAPTPAGPAAAAVASAAPGPLQTSEYLIGSVAVGIILPESADGTEDWANPDSQHPGMDRRQLVLNGIQEGLDWWAAADPRADLSFVYDVQLGVPTSYEPIGLAQSQEGLWIGDVMANLGYSSAGGYHDSVLQYVNALRDRYDTDWAFAILVVDSLQDADGLFADELYFAYAYVGGPFLVMTYDLDGWGIDRMGMIAAHEVGHIFLALDEYYGAGQDCTARSGYLNVENQNSLYPGGGCALNQACIMRSSELAGPCAYTRGQVGWRDGDGDGILDPVDTRPSITVDLQPPQFSSAGATATFAGQAEEVPYHSPARTDVTINHIAAIEYRLDGGPLRPAAAVDGALDGPLERFTLTTPPLSEGAHSLTIRATNRVGNAATWSSAPFAVDTVPPSSAVSPLAALSLSTFTVRWSGSDATSGIAGYDLQYRRESEATWTGWLSATTATSHAFTGQEGETYFFRCRATDGAGNIEPWPAGPGQASTHVTPGVHTWLPLALQSR